MGERGPGGGGGGGGGVRGGGAASGRGEGVYIHGQIFVALSSALNSSLLL